MSLAELGIETGTATELAKLEAVPERSGAKMLEGDLQTQVGELVRILKEEEKLI
jgi:electron transfer flavoprotein beta subunit